MNIYSLAQIAQYNNIPELQTQYLKENASTGARNLYEALYKLGRRTDGIIIKSLAYVSKIVQYSSRHISRLTKELEELGCLETLPRANHKGKLCNQYVLMVPEQVAEAIQAKPRKPSLAAKLKQMKESAVFKHIDFSQELQESAYYAACSDIEESDLQDKNVMTHIFSDYVRENNNKGEPLAKAGPPLINAEQLTEKHLDNLEEFVMKTSNEPQQLFDEMIFAIERRFFKGQSLLHATNMAKKIVRDGNWSTPFGMYKVYRESLPKKEAPPVEPIQASVVYVRNPLLPGETIASAMTRLQAILNANGGKGKAEAAEDLYNVLRMGR